MAKKSEIPINTISDEFRDSIENYGKKIEHIESFVEAVRRFPGK